MLLRPLAKRSSQRAAYLGSRSYIANVRTTAAMALSAGFLMGVTTLMGIAEELTRQKWPTARGAESWSMMAVSNILKRVRPN